MDFHQKYARLIVDYCLYLKPNQKLLIRTGTAAEPLMQWVQAFALERGAMIDLIYDTAYEEDNFLEYANADQMNYSAERLNHLIESCDALLTVRALRNPDHSHVRSTNKAGQSELRRAALSHFNKVYFERLGNGSLKRCLCQYPTEFSAELAKMSLKEYEQFIINACYLNHDQPEEQWKLLSKRQQVYVDHLNRTKRIEYRHPNFEISANVEGRIWINSDGKSNMPSGEVFTSPIEDSVEGTVFFDYPTRMFGKDLRGIKLEVKKGEIVYYSAEEGQEVLDKVFAIPGTRRFGEIAIGTNNNIRQATNNILFDEKIGGTVHMAVGQSYKQCGGKNESDIHWDLITDMKNGGEIWTDGILIYSNGNFLI